jgi:hypothetical protein
MLSILRNLLVFLFIVLASASAAGQTTQPADDTWLGVVQTAAASLSTGDAASLRPVLADKYTLHNFAGGREGEWPAAVETLGDATVLGTHAMVYPPLAVAAEVAADVKSAPQLPEKIRERFIPLDEIEMKRANATAVQWIKETLGAENGDPIALIVMWVDPTAPNAGERPNTLLFVLLRGKATPEGTYRITHVVYGDPLPAK